MFYSRKYNILFIAIPKTGSITAENAFFQLDPEGENHSMTINGTTYHGRHFAQGIIGHARAWEIREVIGAATFDELYTIALVRNPYAKLVSAYAFNKQNDLWGFRKMKGEKKRGWRQLKNFFTIAIAKLLPFFIWAFVYPYRTNHGYVFDRNGKRLVKYVGRTEHLVQDMQNILADIGIPAESIEIGHKNKSSHAHFEQYFTNPIFKKLIAKKVGKDLDLYTLASQEMEALQSINGK